MMKDSVFVGSGFVEVVMCHPIINFGLKPRYREQLEDKTARPDVRNKNKIKYRMIYFSRILPTSYHPLLTP
jgi:hypothetical protein